ncbi:MAG: macrocin O-methyltransferase [Cyanothece sp. SIO2G6]|nr:macrocin O-methyltransferase [Cyanothece sp. SIO2G6]
MNRINSIAKPIFPSDFGIKNIEAIKLVQPYTMTSPERLNSLINAVQYIIDNNINGSIVECGVWKGGSMMAVAYMLQALSNMQRNLYLFDTFEGMTPPTDKDIAHFNVDAKTLMDSEDEKKREIYRCYASLEEVKNNLYSTNYPLDKIHFIQGKVEDTIPDRAPEKIALLRLDTDWYESTRHELEHLFPRLVPGGVIIIDDYGYWKGCKQATDEYIQNHRIPLLLNRIDSTGRIGIKLTTHS